MIFPITFLEVSIFFEKCPVFLDGVNKKRQNSLFLELQFLCYKGTEIVFSRKCTKNQFHEKS